MVAAATAGQDRFERVGFAAWKAGGGMSSGDSKAEHAEAEMRLLLGDGEWHTVAEIVEALRSEGIGRYGVEAALEALEMTRVISSRRRGQGGAKQFRLCGELPADHEVAGHDTGLVSDF